MSVPYYGDFPTDHTSVVIPFNAFTSDDPSASATITDFANTDVHIHKIGSLTQRSSSSGVAIDIDVDGITGGHWITIDLSDNTDAGFYAAGSEISVRIEGVTIDGATVNAFVGAFSIERAGGALALLKNATYGLDKLVRSTTPANTLDVSATGEAGLDFDNIKDATGAHTLTNITVPTVTTVGTCTTNSDMVSEPPTASAIVDEWETQSQADPTGFHVNVKEVNGTAQTANDNGADINAILIDTNELQGDWTNNGRLDLILDELTTQGDTNEGKIDIIDTNVDSVLTDTADMQPKLGAPAGADLATDIAAIKTDTGNIETDTQDIQSRIPAALTGGGNIKVDVLAINGTTITGDGNATKWGPA